MQTKKQSGWLSVFGFIAMAGAIASILFLRAPSVQGVDVERRLGAFSDYLNRQAARTGREAAITYRAIAIEGMGYDDYVKIEGLHAALSSPGAPDDGWALDAEAVTVTLDPLNPKRIIFKFADAITITHHDRKTFITLPTPVKFGYLQDDDAGAVVTNLLTLRVPAKLTLGNPNWVLMVSYDENPDIGGKRLGNGEQEAKYELRNIIVQSGNEQQETIGATAGNLTEKPEGNRFSGALTMTVSDFTRRVGGSGKTCSLTSRVDYGSDVSLVNPFGLPDNAVIDAKLTKWVLACDDFSIRAEGDFTITGGAPTGLINVTIDPVKPFLASDLLSEQIRSELTSALPSITGQAESPDKITIAIRRDRDGPLMLGAVSAKQAGITLLKEY